MGMSFSRVVGISYIINSRNDNIISRPISSLPQLLEKTRYGDLLFIIDYSPRTSCVDVDTNSFCLSILGTVASQLSPC